MRTDETTKKDYKGIWIYAEVMHGKLVSTAYELLFGARKLAQDLPTEISAVLMGSDVAKYADELIARGADKVYIIEDPALENFVDDIYTKALADLIRTHKPDKMIIPASTIGRSLAAKVAIEVETGLTADATDIVIHKETGLMHATRPTFGGNLMATIVCKNHRPEMVSLRPLTYPKAERTEGRKGEKIRFSFDSAKYTSKAVFREFVKELSDDIDIGSAEVIVAGGRGLGGGESFKLLKDLAQTMGGAVGASRAAVDAGWITFRHQIGLTGKTVKPKLYIAAGISGQVQHMAGINSSDIIVAINKDPEAPIMKQADYAITGDLFEVIPALIEEYNKHRKS
ncbi:MAG: electron transfer flavoprotein subunit alpha/FixB family protein [Elusimicrobiaceae bacterium]|jgi:electron transfer flavoprotein alpha subunit